MIIPARSIHFKEGFEKVLLQEWQQLHPVAQLIAEEMARYFELHGKKFVITDIISNEAEDRKYGRVSSSHREGRAFDFRVHGLTRDFLDAFEKRFEHIYKTKAAISKESGTPQLIVIHDNGNGNHGHVQIRRGL